MQILLFVLLHVFLVNGDLQQEQEKDRMSTNNPYLWMLSNQLYQLHRDVKVLKNRKSANEDNNLALARNIDKLLNYDKKRDEQVTLLINLVKSLQKQCACRWGWEFYKDHCYYFSQEKVTWHEAKTKCEQNGSILAKIESEDEHKWIAARNSDVYRPWIGLNDIKAERQWRWASDNALATLKGWTKGEPSSLRTENCVHYQYHGWNDVNCGSQYPFICETY